MEAVMTRQTDERPNYPVVEAIIDVIADWVKKHRYAVGLRDELARCGPEEVVRAAPGVSVSRADTRLTRPVRSACGRQMFLPHALCWSDLVPMSKLFPRAPTLHIRATCPTSYPGRRRNRRIPSRR